MDQYFQDNAFLPLFIIIFIIVLCYYIIVLFIKFYLFIHSFKCFIIINDLLIIYIY